MRLKNEKTGKIRDFGNGPDAYEAAGPDDLCVNEDDGEEEKLFGQYRLQELELRNGNMEPPPQLSEE